MITQKRRVLKAAANLDGEGAVSELADARLEDDLGRGIAAHDHLVHDQLDQAAERSVIHFFDIVPDVLRDLPL